MLIQKTLKVAFTPCERKMQDDQISTLCYNPLFQAFRSYNKQFVFIESSKLLYEILFELDASCCTLLCTLHSLSPAIAKMRIESILSSCFKGVKCSSRNINDRRCRRKKKELERGLKFDRTLSEISAIELKDINVNWIVEKLSLYKHCTIVAINSI